eukprot:scaffold33056_cov101-Isochrysis_galbana.AAC.1
MASLLRQIIVPVPAHATAHPQPPTHACPRLTQVRRAELAQWAAVPADQRHAHPLLLLRIPVERRPLRCHVRSHVQKRGGCPDRCCGRGSR